MSQPFFKQDALGREIGTAGAKSDDRFERLATLMLESVQRKEQQEASKGSATDPMTPEVLILEAVKRKEANLREDVMNAVIGWASEESPSLDGIFDIAFELAGLDEIEPVDDAYPQEATDDYFIVLGLIADALSALGAEASDIETLLNFDEDDEESVSLAEASISDITSEIDLDLDDEEAVEDFVLVFASDNDEGVMMEAMIKVVRQGKVIMKRKRIRPKRMTGAQKSALKKNRRKAWKGQARLKRKKSLKVGKKRGLYNK